MVIEELRAAAKAAEAAARAAALTNEEAEVAALNEKIAASNEALELAQRKRRAIDGDKREKAAYAASKDRRASFQWVDLPALFPAGKAPDVAMLPTKGIIVVRSPIPDRMTAFYVDVEHKQKALPAIYGELVVESTVDPDPGSDDGAKLAAFLEAYPPACIEIGNVVTRLGGTRAAADKRGSG